MTANGQNESRSKCASINLPRNKKPQNKVKKRNKETFQNRQRSKILTDIQLSRIRKKKIERLIDFVNDVDMKMFGSDETKKNESDLRHGAGIRFMNFSL